MPAITRVSRPAVTAAAAARIKDDAAQRMWVYYRNHKSQLVSHIREYRDSILAELIAGVPVEAAFAPYARPADAANSAAKPLRRAA